MGTPPNKQLHPAVVLLARHHPGEPQPRYTAPSITPVGPSSLVSLLGQPTIVDYQSIMS